MSNIHLITFHVSCGEQFIERYCTQDPFDHFNEIMKKIPGFIPLENPFSEERRAQGYEQMIRVTYSPIPKSWHEGNTYEITYTIAVDHYSQHRDDLVRALLMFFPPYDLKEYQILSGYRAEQIYVILKSKYKV